MESSRYSVENGPLTTLNFSFMIAVGVRIDVCFPGNKRIDLSTFPLPFYVVSRPSYRATLWSIETNITC